MRGTHDNVLFIYDLEVEAPANLVSHKSNFSQLKFNNRKELRLIFVVSVCKIS